MKIALRRRRISAISSSPPTGATPLRVTLLTVSSRSLDWTCLFALVDRDRRQLVVVEAVFRQHLVVGAARLQPLDRRLYGVAQRRLGLGERHADERLGEGVAEQHVGIGLERLEIGQRLVALDGALQPLGLELGAGV